VELWAADCFDISSVTLILCIRSVYHS
jgi:hypothetical protein